MTVMYFQAERAIFAVDFIYPGTSPNVHANSAFDWIKYSVGPSFATARPNAIEAAYLNLRDYR
jgi:hypothetical protein